jgi:hypothetical protein
MWPLIRIAAVPILKGATKLIKSPVARAGGMGFMAGKSMGNKSQSEGRTENFNNWFPGATDGDGAMR